MVPVNLVELVPQKVGLPLLFDVVVVGSNDMPITSDEMVPWPNRLSVTVGKKEPLSGDKVSTVKSAGRKDRDTEWAREGRRGRERLDAVRKLGRREEGDGAARVRRRERRREGASEGEGTEGRGR